jgi:hypothetical protein
MRPKVEEPCCEQINIHLKSAEMKRFEEIARLEQRRPAQLGRIIIQNYLRGYGRNGANGSAPDGS